jgi:hypothetical protein
MHPVHLLILDADSRRRRVAALLRGQATISHYL